PKPKVPMPQGFLPRTRYRNSAPGGGTRASLTEVADVDDATHASVLPSVSRTTSYVVALPSTGPRESQEIVARSPPRSTPATSPGTWNDPGSAGAQSQTSGTPSASASGLLTT